MRVYRPCNCALINYAGDYALCRALKSNDFFGGGTIGSRCELNRSSYTLQSTKLKVFQFL